MRILIAEDDMVSRKILTTLLTRFGHDVVAVEHGDEALAILQQPDRPRLAVLDWIMPGLDGVEICRKIREQPESNPVYVILLTSKTDEESIVEGLDAGANDYLTKPYRKEELRARIGVGLRMLQLQGDLNAAREALLHEATHDALTGLLNRRAILDGLSRELSRARREGSTLSVGLCDIDFFKKINDRFGHQVGDDVLVGFAQLLLHQLRDFDLIGRYGGEEFLIVAPQTKGVPEEGIYERICRCVDSTPLETRDGKKSMTISLGVAGGPPDQQPDVFLSNADTALYTAKRNGRNQVVYSTRSSLEELNG